MEDGIFVGDTRPNFSDLFLATKQGSKRSSIELSQRPALILLPIWSSPRRTHRCFSSASQARPR